MDVRFDAEVNPGIIHDLDDLLKLNIKELGKLANDVDVAFTSNERTLFATEGASGGVKWKRLSPRYAAYKNRVKPGRKIMAFDGDLRKSLANRNAPGHALTWSMKPEPHVLVGTNNIKAAWHGPKENNPLAKPKLPVRDVMQHSKLMIDKYDEVVRKLMLSKQRLFLRTKLLQRKWKRLNGPGFA